MNKPDEALLADVIAGLSKLQKTLPAKHLYDERGAALFEQICMLPEYYVSRAELQILQENLAGIHDFVGPECNLIEFGSGSGRKTRLLIEGLKPRSYIPIDLSVVQLELLGMELSHEFPGLHVTPLAADFTGDIRLPTSRGSHAALFMPGSTIGNLDENELRPFLQRTRALAGHSGRFIVGIDLKKDRKILHAAYNDSEGVTAQFNLNILTHVNHRLGADIDVSAFEHLAFYNEHLGQIEMHLKATRSCTFTIAEQRFVVAAGETIHTEVSRKYSVEDFQAVCKEAGWKAERVWTDRESLFSVHGLTA